MTTIVFRPSGNVPFQFQATLDNINYSVVITWNLFGERYFINIYTLNGTLVYSGPLIASPSDYPIQIPPFNYFTTSKIVFYEASQTFEITP